MRTIITTFETLGGSTLVIGYKGESNATQVLINCAEVMAAHPGVIASLVVTSPSGTSYPQEIETVDGVVKWTILARDTLEAGTGSVRVDMLDGNGLVVTSAETRTMIIKTNVPTAAMTGLIAPTENDIFASMEHPAGTYFIFKNVLYRADSTIIQGGLIVTGGTGKNCTAVTVGGELYGLQENLDDLASDLYYQEMQINSMSVSPNQAEMGSTVNNVSIAYQLSKVPDSLMLNNVAQSPAASGTIQLTGQGITTNKIFTLQASDSGSHSHSAMTATQTAALSFLNRVFYGAAEVPGTLNSAFLRGLANSPLASGKARTFSITAGSGKYIWYAVPKRFGTCTFRVGGFVGGFEAAQEISVTNASGYTEAYYVYRSTNAGLGSPEIVVT